MSEKSKCNEPLWSVLKAPQDLCIVKIQKIFENVDRVVFQTFK